MLSAQVVSVHCDYCDNMRDVPIKFIHSPEAARKWAKKEGWIVLGEGSGPFHDMCPTCAKGDKDLKRKDRK